MRLLLAPAIWVAHFIVLYLLVSLVCAGGAADVMLFGYGIVPVGATLATVVALSLITATAWGDVRRLRKPGDGDRTFIARVGVLLCALSALAVTWGAYPAFVLPACAS